MPYQYVDSEGKPAVDPGTGTQVVAAQPVLETPEQQYARLYPSAQPQATTVQTPAPAASSPAPVVATLPPEVLETITALRSEMASMKESIKPPAPVVTPQSGPPAWVEKIRTGEFDGATDALATTIQDRLATKFQEVRNQAYQDALSATQVNIEIDRHVQRLRQENPELTTFEKYLQAPVAQRVEEAKASGKIKSPTDFIREYKSAIDAEVGELRNLGLVLRGQGKQEAQTRNQQVLASTTLVPNQVQSTSQIEQTPSVPDVTIESYFNNRRAGESRNHGMS